MIDEDDNGIINPQKKLSKAYLLPWYTSKTNVVIKGSKGSGKSYFAAFWHIYHMMNNKYASTLVVRKVGDTIADSCYQDLKRVIHDFHLESLWKCTMQPMRMTYIPTGQAIIFRGLDDPYKLASVNAPPGTYLCWVWFEEAFDFTNYEDILKIQASIRAIPEETGLKKRFTFTFNPWHQYHWLKEEFFDKERADTLALTTTFEDNPAFKEADKQFYRDLAKYNPIQARVIVYGEWGTSEGLIYNNWKVEVFDPDEIRRDPNVREMCGLDFGYSVSYNAFSVMLVNPKTHDLWIYDEMYQKGMTNLDIVKYITKMGYDHAKIVADCQEAKSIRELQEGLINQEPDGSFKRYSLPNIEPALKGKDSVRNGIQRLQTFKIHVLPRCQGHIMEFSSYAWKKDKDGKYTGDPEKEHDHAMDAVRYPIVTLLRNSTAHVAVIKGADVDMFDTRPKVIQETIKCSRVAATHE